jgi:adenylate cyclase
VTGGRVERRLAAVLAADVAGYSRLMGADEVGTLEALKAIRREIVDPVIAEHKGRIVKTTGDGMLVEFASAVDAVTCAVAVQQRMAGRAGQIAFRIGINIGDIISDENDIFGDGVNVAARVENECAPGGVCLSGSAFEQVRGKTEFEFDDLGERSLKNIDRPVRLYAAKLGHVPKLTIEEGNRPLPFPDKPSIAVLPFQNMSGDPEQEYFADGMVEDIITALSRFKSLFVIARNSSFTYKGKAVDIKQVGRELGVRYVLEGSVRRLGTRVRITGQLIEATTGSHLWADKFEGGVNDLFDLQDVVTASVAGAIAPRLIQDAAEQVKRKPPESPAKRQEAISFFQKAIELDSHFAAAYAQAALRMYHRIIFEGHPVSDTEYNETIRLVELALRFGGDDDLVLCCSGMLLAQLNYEFDRGLLLANRAIALNANNALAWLAKAWISEFIGDHDSAVEAFDRAMRLDPLNIGIRSAAVRGNAMTYVLTHQYAEGLVWVNRLLAEHPQDLWGLWTLWAVQVLVGNLPDAEAAAARLRAAFPELTASHLKRVIHFQKPEQQALVDELTDRLGLPE